MKILSKFLNRLLNNLKLLVGINGFKENEIFHSEKGR